MVWCLFSFALAMMSPQKHSLEEYIAIGKDYPSVCLIEDEINHISLTGVLIAPDIVLTCAHGIRKNGIYRLTFSRQQTATSAVALIDPRYLKQGSKFDLALLRLDQPIAIHPSKMCEHLQISLPLITVVFQQGLKRGFYFYELDKFSDASSLEEERHLQLSSIFFNPYGDIPSTATDEMRLRTQEAVSNWKRYGQGPYALALPGSSGSPVFVHYEGRPILLGIITSFSTLDGKVYTPLYAQEAFGWYQTIFIPLYVQTESYNVLSAWYKKDEELDKLIKKIRLIPQPNNPFRTFYERYLRPFFSQFNFPTASR